MYVGNGIGIGASRAVIASSPRACAAVEFLTEFLLQGVSSVAAEGMLNLLRCCVLGCLTSPSPGGVSDVVVQFSTEFCSDGRCDGPLPCEDFWTATCVFPC